MLKAEESQGSHQEQADLEKPKKIPRTVLVRPDLKSSNQIK